MPDILLERFETSDLGTIGRVFVDSVPFSFSMEPPWRNNRPNVSCIPVGQYRCVWHKSPKFGWLYLVSDVPGRGFILIHPGNLGGDALKGFKTHTQGCLLLGQRLSWLARQQAVLVSRPTVRRFFKLLDKQDFILTITEVF